MTAEDLKQMFGKKVKKVREILGLSRVELSKEAGIKPITLYRIEKGLTEPKTSTIEKLQNALGISYSDFFDFNNDMINEIKKKYICSSITKLDKDGLEKYFNIMKVLIKFAKQYNINESTQI